MLQADAGIRVVDPTLRMDSHEPDEDVCHECPCAELVGYRGGFLLSV